MFRSAACAAALLTLAMPALAGMDDFIAGDVVPSFGKFAPVEGVTLPADTHFKVAFDVSEAGPDDDVNRGIDSVARFLNMNAHAGVLPENMKVAIILHGGAWKDLLTDEARGSVNPNAQLIAELQAAGATFDLCGQTAAAHDVTPDMLLPGINIVLSAMTERALLQQEGYTLN
ncbi:MAG TPA: DsrE family protein [Hyphomonas sp.]|nr:DsrE family protein [Hyphomonas sp.]MCA8904556.1 DsrE family protein [Hyphomonas sp.]HPE49279.1 DsrE family protein [Hyphomonas sp.]